MRTTLTGAEKAAYDSIFRHPAARNLEWHSLVGVFKHLGEIEEHSDGGLKFTRNGQTLLLHANGKEVDIDELIRIRHFLTNTEASAATASGTKDVVVVLDHSGARIFRVDDIASAPLHIRPVDPRGEDQHVHNPKGDSGGKQGPYRNLFYEALATALAGANRILLVGDGHGASNEAGRFLDELQTHHHPDLIQRIVGPVTADISHMTDGDFTAMAREFFS